MKLLEGLGASVGLGGGSLAGVAPHRAFGCGVIRKWIAACSRAILGIVFRAAVELLGFFAVIVDEALEAIAGITVRDFASRDAAGDVKAGIVGHVAALLAQECCNEVAKIRLAPETQVVDRGDRPVHGAPNDGRGASHLLELIGLLADPGLAASIGSAGGIVGTHGRSVAFGVVVSEVRFRCTAKKCNRSVSSLWPIRADCSTQRGL